MTLNEVLKLVKLVDGRQIDQVSRDAIVRLSVGDLRLLIEAAYKAGRITTEAEMSLIVASNPMEANQ